MEKKVLKDIIICAIVSLGLSVSYDTALKSLGMNNFTSPGDVIWLIFAISFYIIIQYYRKNVNTNKRLQIVTTIVSLIIALLFTIGQMFTDYLLSGDNGSKKLIIYAIIKFFLYTIINKYLISIAYSFIEKWKIQRKNKKNNLFVYNKKNFIILTIIIFISYIPWFLNYFPGICSPDSLNQMMQIIGVYPFTGHHPITHTAVIWLCLKIGRLISDYNAGIAIYSILQMLCCAMTFAYTVLYLDKKKVAGLIQFILLLFFMFCPIIGNYSIVMWKDIPFALCILISTTYIVDLFTEDDFSKNKRNYFLLGLFLLLDCLFRKNGLYCIILLFVVMLFIKIENKKIVLISIVMPIIITCLFTWPISTALDIKPGDDKEAYTVIMQQFAAVRKYHSDKLTAKEKKELDSFFIDQTYIELYYPVFADPVKRVFSEKYSDEHRIKMIKTYLKYMLKYPKTTIKAFIAGNYGYYYPNLVGWEVYNKIDSAPQLQIKQTPIVRISIINKLNELLNNHNIPIIGVLCSCGLYALLLVFVIGYMMYKKLYKLLPSTILVIGVELTAMLSPVFCERRYVYSVYLVVPLLLALCFSYNLNHKSNKK